jgi:hypothetical protein
MENLVRELLKIKFPTVELDSLMEIINATPNVVVATEILCGVYQEPQIKKRIKNGKKIYEFDSYNKWENRVYYHYLEERAKSGYFPEDLDLSTVTLENFEKLEVAWDTKNVKRHSLLTGEVKEAKGNMGLENWNNHEEIVND